MESSDDLSSAGVSDNHIQDVEGLLMGICVKFKKAQQSGVDSEVIAQAVQHIEQADKSLNDAGIMDEGLEHDRKLLIGQVQTLGKRIANRVSFSQIPDGSLSVMVSNLEAIANKL